MPTACRWMLAGLLTAALLASAGCGGRKTYPAGGKVVYKGTSQPLKGGLVIFELVVGDAKVSARGTIDDEGTFLLGTFREDDGALEGEHRVAVIPRLPSTMEEAEKAMAETIDQRYRNLDTSGLRFTVTRDATKNQFTIEVDKPAKKKRP